VFSCLLCFGLLPVSSTLQDLQTEANALRPLVKNEVTRAWLDAVPQLPEAPVKTLYSSSGKWVSKGDYEKLDAEAKKKARVIPVTTQLYYDTKYGSPLAYARALDLAEDRGLGALRGAKIVDFGYGGIGQLRLFAAEGAHANGIDVDPFLTALYSSPSDSGRFGHKGGSVRTFQGFFPSDSGLVSKLGTGYSLFISKNTLKRGYVHPERPAPKAQLVDLGVSDEVFLARVHDLLKPGGLFVIYNLCPAPAPLDKPYIPWADGRSPFSAELLKKAGFEVLDFDVNDDAMARKLGHAMGWDVGDGAMDLEHDLFGTYTIARRT
jgi:hypothetical protein